MYYKIFLLFFFCLQTESMLAQELPVFGKIITSDGQPIAKASIRLSSSKNMALSAEDGTFNIITSSSNDTLLISHLNFTTARIPVDKNTAMPLRIRLTANTKQLEQVTIVSTGYQNLPKERATGSFFKIDNKVFNQSVSTDVISRLDGISSGLLFDKRDPQKPKIQIRGLSTLYSQSQPLIVLDNFPYEGDINNINPNDIEDITLLKDAAAASIWGARAGNGVIVITTKKPGYNQPLTINVNSNVTVTGKPSLMDIPVLPSSDYIDLEKDLFSRGFYNIQVQYPSFYPLTPAVEILLKNRKGLLTNAQTDAQLNVLKSADVRNDFKKYIYRQAVNQQYAMNMSGGSTFHKFMFSAGYDHNLTNLKGNDYSRISIRANNTFIPVKNLQIQTDLLYTDSKTTSNSPGGYGSGSYKMRAKDLYPYAQFADAQGNPLSLDNQFGRAYTDTAGGGQLLDWHYKVLQELQESDQQNKQYDFLGNLALNYQVMPSLSAEFRYQYERTFNQTRNDQNVNRYTTRDLINRFTNLAASDPAIRNPVPIGDILDLNEGRLSASSLRGQLNFNKTWNNKHQLSLLAGAEQRQSITTSIGTRSYGYHSDPISFKNVDYVNLYPIFDGLDDDSAVPSGNGFSHLMYRYISTYFSGAYTFDNRYTLSASARRDASNIFGVAANDKGTPLWSAGVAWNLSKEKFYKSELVPYLKLRATYGYSGNVNQSVSALTILRYYPASNSIFNLQTADVQNGPNPHLKWEKVKMINTGIDFATKNNRISGSLEYYAKKSIDLIAAQNLDLTTGLGSIVTNSANMTGSGIDLVLNSKNIDQNFKWNTTLLFNHSRYKVTKILIDDNNDGYVSDGKILIPIEGYNPYEVVSYRWAGLDPKTGDPQGYLNGQVSKDYNALLNNPLSEQVKHGSGLPLYFGNFRNTFSYEGLSVTINIAYSFDYYFRKPSINYSRLFSNGVSNIDYLNRWQHPGDETRTNVPALVYPNNNARDNFYERSAVNILPGDHVRLQDVFISYDLSQPVLNRCHIKHLQFYCSFSNLNFLLWKANRADIDPNYPLGLKPASNIAIGIKANL